MRRRAFCPMAGRASLMAGMALLLAAAGGIAQSPAPDASPAASVVPGPLTTPFPDATATVAVLPGGSVIDPRPTPWDHVTIWPDGRTLSVAFRMGRAECEGIQKVELGREQGALRITLFTGDRADAAGVDCIAQDALHETVVTLGRPILGGGHASLQGVQVAEPMGERIDAGRALREDEPQPWQRVQVAGDGATLLVSFLGGSTDCYGLSRVDTPVQDGLRLAVIHYGPRADVEPAQADCDPVGVPLHTQVTLDAPLLLGGTES